MFYSVWNLIIFISKGILLSSKHQIILWKEFQFFVCIYLKLFNFNFSYYHNPTPIKDILYRKNPKIEDAFLQKGLYHRFLDCKASWNNGKDFDMLILCLFYIHVHFPFFLKLLPKNIIANPSARNNFCDISFRLSCLAINDCSLKLALWISMLGMNFDAWNEFQCLQSRISVLTIYSYN